MHIGHLLTLFCILMAVILIFCNSEVMTSLPHNLGLQFSVFPFAGVTFVRRYFHYVGSEIQGSLGRDI